ncbi:hypothetical protein ACM66B_003341 [Microbotryomycetes sp. NB124-2]
MAPTTQVVRATKSQFIEKLHSLLEHPLDPDSLRWCSDTAFEITANDLKARHALSPQWDFRSLSSFVRQLSYYNFKRLSDRRRSNERRASATGYIVFTHPSGFFVRGDSSQLHRIARKLRPRPNKVGAAAAASTQQSAQFGNQGDDDDGFADNEQQYYTHDRRASNASSGSGSGGGGGGQYGSPGHDSHLALPPLPPQHRSSAPHHHHQHLTYEPVGGYRDAAAYSHGAYYQSPFSPQYSVAVPASSTSALAPPPPSQHVAHAQSMPRQEQSRAVSRLADVSTWRSYSPATNSWQTSYNQLTNRRMSQPDYRMPSEMTAQLSSSSVYARETDEDLASRPRLRKAASSLSIATGDTKVYPTPVLSPYNTMYPQTSHAQTRMPISPTYPTQSSQMPYVPSAVPRYSSASSTAPDWHAHNRQASLPSPPSGSSNPVTPQDEIINPLDRRPSFATSAAQFVSPAPRSVATSGGYVADSSTTRVAHSTTSLQPHLEDDTDSNVKGFGSAAMRVVSPVVNDSWQQSVLPGC